MSCWGLRSQVAGLPRNSTPPPVSLRSETTIKYYVNTTVRATMLQYEPEVLRPTIRATMLQYEPEILHTTIRATML